MLIFVNRAPLHGSNFFRFESYTTAHEENDQETILISFEKNRAEDRCTLKGIISQNKVEIFKEN